MTCMNTSHEADQGDEKMQHEQRGHDDLFRTMGTPGETTDVPRGRGRPQPVGQPCTLCQTATVGACLICHRPLCEQCGASSDDFLRCPSHHEHEVEALRTILRQAAESVLNTRQYLTDLVALRNRVLQEVNAALLRSYVEHTGGVPSPAQIQQMRRVAEALWNSLAVVAESEDTALLRGETSAQQQASEHDET
jgi:hypothetical protein